MTFEKRMDWLEGYYQLCEKHKLYIEGPFGYPLYVREKLYPVDDSFERSIDQLKQDIGA